jgi:glycine cleavage system H protein
MESMKYTREHEWLRTGDDGVVTVGITDYAQEQLGDVVYVELPQPGREAGAGEEIVIIESVKAAGDVKAPCAGTITETNSRLESEPELVNRDPLGDGWLFRMRVADPGTLGGLMNEAGYRDFVRGL